MNEALDMELGRTSVIIVERLESVRLCITADPKDDRAELIARFKPEGKEWEFYQLVDNGDYVYLHYHKLTHPAL